MLTTKLFRVTQKSHPQRKKATKTSEKTQTSLTVGKDWHFLHYQVLTPLWKNQKQKLIALKLYREFWLS